MKTITAAIAIIEKEGQYLIAQRKPDDYLGLYWEFPGGKCEERETLEQCVVREIKEELGITIQIRAKGEILEARTPHRRVFLHSFYCSHLDGTPRALECHDFRWVKARQLLDYQFPPANQKLIHLLVEKEKNHLV
ncbi:MAG: (deoxy)nucleoside triphosphate pyrophosphohydrolase [Candidatus Omnitrophica bacterium]|nr:(deoxy)nucleoside triphosphate pyrophosphohydrolase [Candidatus Omnitrophota bacterium]